MKILIVDPNKNPVVSRANSLREMQKIVGEYIQAVYPWNMRVALVCDKEGLVKGKMPNRFVPKYGMIHGTFFLCGLGEEDFTSLTEEQINILLKAFTIEGLEKSEGEIIDDFGF